MDFILELGILPMLMVLASLLSLGAISVHLIRQNARLEIALAEADLEVCEYRNLSLTDSLTGLGNRRAFEGAADKALAILDRYNYPPVPSTLAIIDLDRFKVINDLLGHEAGDQALLALASVLVECIRNSDVVGRVGGDEFHILFLNAGAKQASSVLERIRAEYERKIDILFEAHDRTRPDYVSLSFGLAERERSDQTRHNLTSKADMALYEAKRTYL